ncbi:MAG TPA: poly-gamma-glutamate hydrolase family protein [Acidimicrobiales bacterium]|nr:poly-gamma-glutamate hydrolase family protein [Acidimicrobiales bacterium]
MIPTTARSATWAELLDHPEVVEGAIKRSAVGVMAFHGGLEAGTAEIAEAVADASGASLYFVNQPAALRWHVPSRAVDPARSPLLADWLKHVQVAIALHGYGRIRQPRRILLGGRNRVLAKRLADRLLGTLSGFEMVTDLAAMPAELRGLHPDNPVNRPQSGGVQVELPPSARGTTPRPPDPAWGPGGAPARIVEALVAGIAEYERSSC